MHNSLQNAIQPKENKKVLSSPLWLLFPHIMKRLQCSSQSTGTEEAVVPFLLYKKGNQIPPLLQFWSWPFHWPWEYCWITVYDWGKISLNAQFRVFLFCIQKTENTEANFQVKQVTHYTKVILQETWKLMTILFELSSLYFGIKTLQLEFVNVWYIKLTLMKLQTKPFPLTCTFALLISEVRISLISVYMKILLQKLKVQRI